MAFRWIAVIVFFLELPNPIFWLVVHPQIRFWRARPRAAYTTALLFAWIPVTVFLIVCRHTIFAQEQQGDLRTGLALLLIATGIWFFGRAKQDLGTARFIGKVEILGVGEVVDSGIYSYVRNPRYVGMILAVFGACLFAGTALMWTIFAIWLALVLVVIGFEERELRARLGAPYIAYCRRVPRFLPCRALVRAK